LNTFYILNFGCKLNIYESESIGFLLTNNGYVQINNCDVADIVIINTCTVTAKADAKSRNTIRKVKRNNPDCCLIVCGCMVDTEKDILHNLHEIDVLIENKNKDKIIQVIHDYNEGLFKQKPFLFQSDDDGTFNFNTFKMNNHSRAFIKIQDGCNNFCTYCKIPFARGRSRSRDVNDILSDVMNIEKNGYQEIVITGINISDYNFNGINLSGLLTIILEKTSHFRIRLSSLEPQNIDTGFYEVIKNNRICPHFHIALQHGSDSILSLMNRKYTADYFSEIIDKIRKSKPSSFISTDLILGFPGESEEDFEKTKQLLHSIRFSFVHIFSYSPRKGTTAYDMTPKVPERIRDQRVYEIGEINKIYHREYIHEFINKELNILIDATHIDKYQKGKSENYLDILVESDSLIRGHIYNVTIKECDEDNKIIAKLN